MRTSKTMYAASYWFAQEVFARSALIFVCSLFMVFGLAIWFMVYGVWFAQ